MRLHQNDRCSSRRVRPDRAGRLQNKLRHRPVYKTALRVTAEEIRTVENKIDLMRRGTLVDSAVFRHLVIFHQTKAPIDQGLFVFVG